MKITNWKYFWNKVKLNMDLCLNNLGAFHPRNLNQSIFTIPINNYLKIFQIRLI